MTQGYSCREARAHADDRDDRDDRWLVARIGGRDLIAVVVYLPLVCRVAGTGWMFAMNRRMPRDGTCPERADATGVADGWASD
jgi:hypothetical protein